MDNPEVLTKKDLHQLLKTHFGYDEFLPHQEEVIQNFLKGKDSVVIMPTGGGKSLCFQLSALAVEGTCIVISPLIALMKDQVDALKANGISAEFFNSSLEYEEKQDILNRLQNNKIKLLYLAPESLSQIDFVLDQLKVNLFAIDEAHCISAWGHDFRPHYRQLGYLKSRFPDVPLMALTATADRATREDIAVQLNIPQATVFISSFDRPNLYLDIRAGRNRRGQILRFLTAHPGESGIIYCLSRKGTENLAQALVKNGYKAEAYHAGLSSEERTSVQERFINDETPIVVATIAFGMGIDKSNVRWVIHYNLPKNIESYYQEIGRSGRDGLPAHTILFHSYADIIQLRQFMQGTETEEYQVAKLERMQQYAESINCRRRTLLSYFGEHIEKDCGHCDMCKNPPKFFDATIITQKICSAVARLKEKESINMVVDVLRGARNISVLEKNYQNIKTYGAAKDVSWKNLQDYVVQLINQGVLEIHFHENGRLVLTDLAKRILFDNQKIKLATPIQEIKEPEITFDDYKRTELFAELRRLRMELARVANVPPYVIFGDASLEDMDKKRPQTKEEFSRIYGVGEVKLDRYADAFLEVINLYNDKNQTNLKSKNRKTLFEKLLTLRDKLAEKEEKTPEDICTQEFLGKLADESPRNPEEFQKLTEANQLKSPDYIDLFLKSINRHYDELVRTLPSHQHSYKLYKYGMSIEEVAHTRGLTENSVMGHLLKVYQEGEVFDLSPFISPEEIKKIREARIKLDNPETLRTYFDYFEEQIPYWKIRWGLELK